MFEEIRRNIGDIIAMAQETNSCGGEKFFVRPVSWRGNGEAASVDGLILEGFPNVFNGGLTLFIDELTSEWEMVSLTDLKKEWNNDEKY